MQTPPWHTLIAKDGCARVGVESLAGLSDAEARKRLAPRAVGPGGLEAAERRAHGKMGVVSSIDLRNWINWARCVALATKWCCVPPLPSCEPSNT